MKPVTGTSATGQKAGVGKDDKTHPTGQYLQKSVTETPVSKTEMPSAASFSPRTPVHYRKVDEARPELSTLRSAMAREDPEDFICLLLQSPDPVYLLEHAREKVLAGKGVAFSEFRDPGKLLDFEGFGTGNMPELIAYCADLDADQPLEKLFSLLMLYSGEFDASWVQMFVNAGMNPAAVMPITSAMGEVYEMPLAGVAALYNQPETVDALLQAAPKCAKTLELLSDMPDPRAFELVFGYFPKFNYMLEVIESYSGEPLADWLLDPSSMQSMLDRFDSVPVKKHQGMLKRWCQTIANNDCMWEVKEVALKMLQKQGVEKEFICDILIDAGDYETLERFLPKDQCNTLASLQRVDADTHWQDAYDLYKKLAFHHHDTTVGRLSSEIERSAEQLSPGKLAKIVAQAINDNELLLVRSLIPRTNIPLLLMEAEASLKNRNALEYIRYVATLNKLEDKLPSGTTLFDTTGADYPATNAGPPGIDRQVRELDDPLRDDMMFLGESRHRTHYVSARAKWSDHEISIYRMMARACQKGEEEVKLFLSICMPHPEEQDHSVIDEVLSEGGLTDEQRLETHFNLMIWGYPVTPMIPASTYTLDYARSGNMEMLKTCTPEDLGQALYLMLSEESALDNIKALEYMIEAGLDLEQPLASGRSPLEEARRQNRGFEYIKMIELGAKPPVPEAGKDTRYKAQLLIVHEDFDDSLLDESFVKHPDRTDVISLRQNGDLEPLCMKNSETIRQARANGDKIRVIVVSHGYRISEQTPGEYAESFHELLDKFGLGNDNPPYRIRFESCRFARGKRIVGDNYALDVFEKMKELGMDTSFNVSMGDHASQYGEGSGVRTMDHSLQLSPLWQGKEQHVGDTYDTGNGVSNHAKLGSRTPNLKGIIYNDEKGKTQFWVNPNPDGHRDSHIP